MISKHCDERLHQQQQASHQHHHQATPDADFGAALTGSRRHRGETSVGHMRILA